MDACSDLNGYLQKLAGWEMPGLFIAKDLNLRYLAANRAATELFGFKNLDHMIGKTSYDMQCAAAEFAQQFSQEDSLVIQNNNNLNMFYCVEYADGNIHAMLGTKKPLKDPSTQETIGTICHTTFLDFHLVNNLINCFLAADKKHLGSKKPVLGCYSLGEKFNNNINLTGKQSICLFYLLRGKSIKEIAHRLNRSARTIENHVEKLKAIFECTTKSGLIEKAIELGFLFYIPSGFLK